MLQSIVSKKQGELMKEIKKEKNFFRKFAKAMELEGLIKYMNNVQ